MQRVFMNLQEIPTMRHIIRAERNTHIINTAAKESNIYHIVKDGSAAEKTKHRQNGVVILFKDYT